MMRALTSVPEPGSSSETRLPLRSADGLDAGALAHHDVHALGVEVGDQAQVGTLGLPS